MAALMRETFSTIRWMALGFTSGRRRLINMKDSGKTTKSMEKVY
jgi:hypothetical protein